MRRKILTLATAVFILAACHNSNSSTVGEKDEDYAKTFGHDALDPHEPPPPDNVEVHQPVDTVRTPQHHTDTTQH